MDFNLVSSVFIIILQIGTNWCVNFYIRIQYNLFVYQLFGMAAWTGLAVVEEELKDVGDQVDVGIVAKQDVHVTPAWSTHLMIKDDVW